MDTVLLHFFTVFLDPSIYEWGTRHRRGIMRETSMNIDFGTPHSSRIDTCNCGAFPIFYIDRGALHAPLSMRLNQSSLTTSFEIAGFIQ